MLFVQYIFFLLKALSISEKFRKGSVILKLSYNALQTAN